MIRPRQARLKSARSRWLPGALRSGGGSRIRTHGRVNVNSFQDCRNRPLYHLCINYYANIQSRENCESPSPQTARNSPYNPLKQRHRKTPPQRKGLLFKTAFVVPSSSSYIPVGIFKAFLLYPVSTKLSMILSVRTIFSLSAFDLLKPV